MDISELKAFIQERFLEYDPGADIDEGSALDTDVIQPLLDYLGESPFDTKAYEFVLDRLQQFNPNDLVDQGDSLVDLAVKPLSFILDPLVFELTRIKNSLSFRYPELMTREAAESLGANFFVSIKEGTYTGGTARLYFSSPIGLSVNQTNILETVNGELFVPHFVQAISQAEMLLNRQGSFYYWDVQIRSVDPGSFDVGPGEIVSIEGLDSVVRVTNIEALTIGEAQESVTDFVSRAAEALTERSLVTARGVSARLRELFPEIRSLEVSGYNDIEMSRDSISYEGSGDRGRAKSINTIAFPRLLPLGTADRITVETDDGAGGNTGPYTLELAAIYNNIGELVQEINKQWLAVGGKGTIASSWGENRLLIHSWTGIPNSVQEAGESWVRLITPPGDRSAWSLLGFVAAQLDTPFYGTSGIIVSSMPGGILRPNTVEGNFAPEDRNFHIGGCTDIFVRPNESTKAEALLADIEDNKPAWYGTKLRTNPVVGNSDQVRDESSTLLGSRPGRPDWSVPLNISEPDLKYAEDDVYNSDFLNGVQVEPGDVLVIRDNVTLGGAYTVAATKNEDSTLLGEDLRLNQLLPLSTNELAYHVATTLRLNLIESKRRVKITSIHGTKLQGFGGSATVIWQGPVFSGIDTNNFHRYGVEPGDILEVYYQSNGEASNNVGEYTVEEVNGNKLTLNRPFISTELITFRVYEEGTDAIDRPLVRLRAINLLDASGAPTGVTVPHALPVVIQSQGISGARIKMEGNNGVIDGSTIFKVYDLSIPNSTIKHFNYNNIQVGDVVELVHTGALGANPVYRTVHAVTDYKLTFAQPLPIQAVSPFTYETDVRYSIGIPARGVARLYFQEPVSFEVRHELLTRYSTFRWNGDGVSPSFKLGARGENGNLAYGYQPRNKGFLGGKRIYPARATGEDPERWNLDLDLAPSFARDVSYDYDASPGNYGNLLFSEMKTREHGILPTEISTELVVGDAVLLYPERLLGQGNIAAYTSESAARIDAIVREAHSLAAMIPESNRGSLSVPHDFFYLTANGFADDPLSVFSVEGRWGQLTDAMLVLGDQPDGAPSPNAGTFRVNEAEGFTLSFRHTGLQAPAPLQPTDPLVNECGRASYDQWILTLNSGAFVVGEEVTFTGASPALSARVGYWDSTTKKAYLYGLSRQATIASVIGLSLTGASGAGTVLSGDTLVYADPQDGTKKIEFSGGAVAPGFIQGQTNGPWQIGNFVALFGNSGTPVSQTHAEALLDCMGTWKITAVSADGKEITVENVGDSSKTFSNPAATPLTMKWVVSDGPRPLEVFNVYDYELSYFPITKVIYEESGIVQDGKLEILTGGLFGDYSQGRAFSGVKCPYQITRPGIVRISSTEMQLQQQDGLYYMDLEVVSLGPSQGFNLGLDEYLEITSAPDPVRGAYRGKNKEYVGEGYVIEVEDPALSFSSQERVTVAMYPRVLRPGDTDIETSKIVLDSTSIGISYDRSELVDNVDQVLVSDSERNTSASLLARHFTPAYVLLDLSYSGDVETSTLVSLLQDFINNLTGSDRLEVSDLEAIIHKQGVNFIDQEFSLVALFHDFNRKIVGERSRNYIGGDEDKTARLLTTNRVSHFIADAITFRRL